MCTHSDGSTFYIQRNEKDGIVELDALLCDIVYPEHDIFLTIEYILLLVHILICGANLLSTHFLKKA